MSEVGNFTCGIHQAYVMTRGGTSIIGQLTPLFDVRWQRIRDDISTANITIGTAECCDLLEDLRTVIMELHIVRNGEIVWQGVIVRIEYDWNIVNIYAEDMLWVAKRKVLIPGYNQAYPNIEYVIPRMDWLLREQCYSLDGDPWIMVPHLHPIRSSDEPRTSRVVKPYQITIWEDFDLYAEDMGADYTVVNRDIYYWDLNYAWSIIPPLDESHLSQFPRIVEYGNEAGTRCFVTNGEGYAGSYTNAAGVAAYGRIDRLITNIQDADDPDDPGRAPTVQEIAQWSDTARREVDDRYPAPVSVVIPANTTLMPGAPWEIADLIPGSWFEVSVTRLCRTVSEYQRLHEVVVTESAPEGEKVQFSADSAPATMEIPPT